MNVDLDFRMQQQLASQWCWSAVGVSTDDYYNPQTVWTQCSLVNDQLGQVSCCEDGSSMVCDQPWYLNRALARLNRMGALTAGVLPDETLFEELAKGRPVGVRIQWNGTGNGHFVMVTGFSDNDRGNVTLEIDDPFYGHSTVRKDMFPGSYQTIGGAWTHTYQTV